MLLRWTDFNPTFAALDGFRRRMDRLFEDYNRYVDDEPQWGVSAGWPRIAVQDGGEELMLFAEVPGLAENEIELNLNQNVLTLSGRREVEIPEGYSIHRRERGDYAFSRSFSLPCDVDPEKAKAVVKDGILTVTIAKAETAKPRQITVKAS